MSKDLQKDRSGGFFKGVVIGGLVAGVAALLFAPKSGKETQEDIKRKARTMKHDLDVTLEQMQNDLVGRIDNLKDVAKDLQGEAKQESEGLIKQAELLKTDLAKSATNLTRVGNQARDEVVTNAKQLLDEGSAIMTELERVTKKMIASAKDKVKRDVAPDQDEV